MSQNDLVVPPEPRLPEVPADALSAEALAYVKASRSPRTLNAYTSDLEHFAEWCHGRGVLCPPAGPSSAATVVAYVTELAHIRKPSTIDRRVAAISVAHQACGFESPTNTAVVRAVLTGIRRTHGVAPEQAAPATIGEIRRMASRLSRETAIGQRDRALLLVGFAGGFRRSELVALTVADLTDCPEGFSLKVRRSKRDQEGRGSRKAIPYGSDPETCPVRALKSWLDVAAIVEGPLFRSVDRHGNVADKALTGQAVSIVVKRAAEAAGLDPDIYSGHSLRAGFITTAAANGRSEREIAAQTGHAPNSAVLRTYIRHASIFTDNAASHLGL